MKSAWKLCLITFLATSLVAQTSTEPKPKKARAATITAADVQALKDAIAAQQAALASQEQQIQALQDELHRKDQAAQQAQASAADAAAKADAAQAQASQDQQAVMRSRGDVTDLKTTTNNTVMALRESLKEVKNVRHYHYPGWLRGSRLCAALARTGSRSTDPLQFADHARGFAEQPVGVLRLRPPVAGFGLFRRPFERCGGFRLHLG